MSLLCGSSTIRALWMTFALNSAFTSAQVAGSLISHSLALMGDTGTMVVDSGTYLINILAEYVRLRGASSRTSAAIDAAAAGISVAALIAVSALTTSESIDRIIHINDKNVTSPPEDINAHVMFAFTLGNLFIDIGMLGSILLRKRGGWLGVLSCKSCRASTAPQSAQESPQLPPADTTMDAQLLRIADSSNTAEAGEAINVFSALTHVLADTMRTVTEMTCSLLIWLNPAINGELADAISALIVSAVIIFVALFVVYETWALVRDGVLQQTTVVQSSERQPGDEGREHM